MRFAGLVMVLFGLLLFVLPTYAHYLPFLRNAQAGDLRLWGALFLAGGAIMLSLRKRED